MIIEISTSGGVGGMATAACKRIDVDSQPAPARAEWRERFQPGDLQQLAARSGSGCGADRPTYRISLIRPAARTRTFTIREDQLPPDMLDLIDSI